MFSISGGLLQGTFNGELGGQPRDGLGIGYLNFRPGDAHIKADPLLPEKGSGEAEVEDTTLQRQGVGRTPRGEGLGFDISAGIVEAVGRR